MSISDEEFQRFQNQLVELRTEKYQLENQIKKLSTGQFTKPFSSFIAFFISRKCSIKSSN